MDKISKERRSYNMSRVRSKNTRPEIILFKLLRKSGIKFKKHYKVTGRPDAAIPEKKIAVFIDGEFWHGKNFTEWKDDVSEFWKNKIGGNIKRDRKNCRILKKDGWKIVRLWGRAFVRNPGVALLRIERLISET